MLKKQKSNYQINVKKIRLLIVFAAIFIFTLLAHFLFKSSSYSFFIEFSNANGIQLGTPIRMRGIYVGFAETIKLKLNSVLVIVRIRSKKVLIPACSVIETTQTGLLNEPVIDIIPLIDLVNTNRQNYDPLSSFCDSSTIICNSGYVIGDRGLNYDDLIRSATRISQRFDDPRFFSIFYIFLQNSIDVTGSVIELIKYFAGTMFINDPGL